MTKKICIFLALLTMLEILFSHTHTHNSKNNYILNGGFYKNTEFENIFFVTGKFFTIKNKNINFKIRKKNNQIKIKRQSLKF